ncbi:hypothetical protein D3C84_875910 [compost metagenome]
MSLTFRRRLVDLLQIRRHRLVVLPGDIAQRVAHHVDDTQLDLGLGILHGNGIREALETIHTRDQDVFQAAVFQLGQER